MEKVKSPVLTSPWKIGLLVSLLLVLLFAGVNYLLMRAFNFSWSWYTITDGQWLFHKDEFITQMLPQLGFTMLLAIIAFAVIKAAVQKYKAFLNSGADYRTLLQSVKSIKDIGDPRLSKNIDSYPELKQFFNSVKDQIAEKENALVQLEKELVEAREAFDKKCDAFMKHINKEPIADIGVTENLKKEFPRLSEVAGIILEKANRNDLAKKDDDKIDLGTYYDDLKNTRNHLLEEFEDISTEILKCSKNAKEIETQLGDLKANECLKDESDEVTAENEIKQIRDSVQLIDELSESLIELGEGTKRVAINTALQAGSGESALDDLIQLAENVKEVAGNFDQMANEYRKLTSQLKDSVDAFSNQTKSMATSEKTELASSIHSLSSMVSLWCERTVVLAEKLTTHKTSYNRSFDSLDEKLKGCASNDQSEGMAVVDNSVMVDEESASMDNGFLEFEKQGTSSNILSSDQAEPVAEPVADQMESVEGMGEEVDPEIPAQQAQYTDDTEDLDMGGFLKDDQQEDAKEKQTESDLFTDLPGDQKVDEPSPKPIKNESVETNPGQSAMDYNSVDLDLGGFESSPPKTEKETPSEHHSSAEMDEGEDVVDLYALGAVDYQPENTETRL